MAREEILHVIVRRHASFDPYDILTYVDRLGIDRFLFSEAFRDVSGQIKCSSGLGAFSYLPTVSAVHEWVRLAMKALVCHRWCDRTG